MAKQPPNARDAAGVTRTQTRGFTLVELIVAISITLIILTVTMTILISSMNISSRSIKTSQGEQVVNACLDYVLDRCTLAERLESSTAALSQMTATTTDFLYVGNASGAQASGRLYLREDGAAPLDVYGEQFYSGGSISLRITYTRVLDQHSVVTATVTLYDVQGSTVARKQRSLALLNSPFDTDEPPENWPGGSQPTYPETFPETAYIIIVPPTPPATP